MPDSFSFHISVEERSLIRQWWAKVVALYFEAHDDCFEYPGLVQYVFMPTGVGTVIKIRDSYSGEELNLTNYDSW